MLLGARVLFGGKGVKWVNPYVTDGLIAMWDAEWNVGGGKHSANATELKDLVGSHNLIIGNNIAITDKALVRNAVATGFIGCSSVGTSLSSMITSLEVGQVDVSQNIQIDTALYVWSNPLIEIARGSGTNRDGVYFDTSWNRFLSRGRFGNAAYANIFDYPYNTTSISWDYPNSQTRYFRNGQLIRTIAPEAVDYPLTPTLFTVVNELYSIRIYNRALTADEIAHNYAIDQQRFGV